VGTNGTVCDVYLGLCFEEVILWITTLIILERYRCAESLQSQNFGKPWTTGSPRRQGGPSPKSSIATLACLASMLSPDITMTVRLFGEKSCIQAIGMSLIDFTSRASDAIGASHKGKHAA
jgi:hypothetical protein